MINNKNYEINEYINYCDIDKNLSKIIQEDVISNRNNMIITSSNNIEYISSYINKNIDNEHKKLDLINLNNDLKTIKTKDNDLKIINKKLSKNLNSNLVDKSKRTKLKFKTNINKITLNKREQNSTNVDDNINNKIDTIDTNKQEGLNNIELDVSKNENKSIINKDQFEDKNKNIFDLDKFYILDKRLAKLIKINYPIKYLEFTDVFLKFCKDFKIYSDINKTIYIKKFKDLHTIFNCDVIQEKDFEYIFADYLEELRENFDDTKNTKLIESERAILTESKKESFEKCFNYYEDSKIKNLNFQNYEIFLIPEVLSRDSLIKDANLKFLSFEDLLKNN